MTREQKRIIRKQSKARIRAVQYAAAAARKREKGGKAKVERRVKINGYSHHKADAVKARKRSEAIARQREYAGLTVAQRLALAKDRGGSVKEIKRLNARIAAVSVLGRSL